MTNSKIYISPATEKLETSNLRQQVNIIERVTFRAVSTNFLGKPFFEMVVFPYQHHGCLEVRKLQVFDTTDLLKTYSMTGVKIVEMLSVGQFYSQQALSKKILGSNCSGTAISAFLAHILINFNQ